MEIKSIKLFELQDFINSDLYKKSKLIPISRQRAISQIHNPRASQNDTVLIVAIDKNKQIVGYIGALPEKLNIKQDLKICWNSCWWTDKEKGKKISMFLFYKLLDEWDSNLIFRDLTDRTKKIILSTNRFLAVKEIYNFKGFLKFNFAEILPRKIHFFKHLTFLLKFIDAILNLKMRIYHYIYLLKIKNDEIKTVEIETVDKEAETFINLYNKNEVIRRGKNELNWILKYPWLTEIKNEENTNAQKKYYFSLIKKQFKNKLIKIYYKEKIIGVVLLTQIDGEVKIPYIYFSSENIDLIVSFLMQFLINNNSKIFFTANKEIVKFISNKKLFFIHKKMIIKDFVISKNIEKYIDKNMTLQDGESDFVFT